MGLGRFKAFLIKRNSNGAAGSGGTGLSQKNSLKLCAAPWGRGRDT